MESSEEKILKFWKKDKTFQKTLDKTKKNKPYVFYDGPPFATGLPHYGHLLASTIKDVVGRFFTMNKRYVKRTWGWDCHGLPIENIAEKELKINSKDEIEKMGVRKFNSFCRGKVLTYAKEWGKVIERLGRWVEFDNSYKTMDNEYIESVWWAFKTLYDKGYIYEGKKVLMYCPRCSTPLSKSEVTMDNSYKTVKETSITVKFKLKDEDVYALAWTTTPWTLPSNLLLAVNPDLDYVHLKDKSDGTIYLMSEGLISKYFKSEKEYEILKKFKGKKLEGKAYEPLFDYFKDNQNSFKFVTGDFVTNEEGTGIVHIAPYGEDDFEVLKKNNVPLVETVNETGHFYPEVKDFAGRYIFDANLEIVIALKKAGRSVASRKIEHDYPFCYRCDTPLIYMPLPAWFVNIQKVKSKLIKLNKKITWYPDFLKEGRFKHNLETAPDWNISRNRYWATAIPIWKAEDGELLVIGSIEELKKYSKKLPKGKIDLHKDYLDDVILEKAGKEFKRIPEVLDCWFESGSMPFAQFHYPFENKELFEKSFPSQYVAEYIGQTRAWFYYMLALSGMLFEDIPFENVQTTGTILAEDGTKMSKSKKNFTDPMIIIDKYGSDALRFYLMGSSVMNADNFNFSDSGVEEIYKKVILLLNNVSNFYTTFKEKGDDKFEKPKNIMDKWILSRLKELNSNVTQHMNDYNTIKACSEIRKFIDDLSTWYVRNSREMFTQGDASVRKTLHRVLDELSKLIAPIMPFSSEKIYQDLYGDKKSIHMENWPENKDKIDKHLTSTMEVARKIVSEGLRIRDKEQIGLKWPLSKVIVYIKGSENLEELKKIILTELNVKKIEFKSPASKETEFDIELDTKITPELKAEGYSRNIIRNVQAFRKQLGLKQGEMVETIIVTEDELKDMLEKHKSLVAEKTNSKKLKIVTGVKETFKNKTLFKVKDKEGEIIIIDKK